MLNEIYYPKWIKVVTAIIWAVITFMCFGGILFFAAVDMNKGVTTPAGVMGSIGCLALFTTTSYILDWVKHDFPIIPAKA